MRNLFTKLSGLLFRFLQWEITFDLKPERIPVIQYGPDHWTFNGNKKS